MSKERSAKSRLLEAYKILTIRRGFSRKKLGKVQNEAKLLESQLKPKTVNKVADQTLAYIEMEEPGIELDQWLGRP